VVDAARRADRLLAVDLCYRFTRAAQAVREVELGDVYAVETAFHNAYGPDKAWFMDPALAGGGCVMDLGIHLVDLARCVLGERRFTDIDAALFNKGRRVLHSANEPEDHALVTLQNDGCTLQLACSWFLDAGRDAVIEATFYGTKAAVSFHNVDGSFYDFEATLMKGTTSKTLVEPPDDWGGRTLVDWATRLAVSPEFDEAVEEHVTLAATIDGIYGRSP
jgi:predicted dehydrogenase